EPVIVTLVPIGPDAGDRVARVGVEPGSGVSEISDSATPVSVSVSVPVPLSRLASSGATHAAVRQTAVARTVSIRMPTSSATRGPRRAHAISASCDARGRSVPWDVPCANGADQYV